MALRMTAKQLKAWQEAAKRERRTLSEWVRITLDDAAKLQAK